MSSEKDAKSFLRSEFAGDPDMQELIQFFVGAMPARIQQLECCIRDRKLDDLRVLAHQLKGASAGYGFSSVGVAAKTLEDDLKASRSLEEIRGDVEELLSLCRRIAA